MLLTDRNFNTSFSDATEEEILFYTTPFLVFWASRGLYLILPGFGIVSILYKHMLIRLFRISWNGLRMLSIGILGFIVWAHHMYTVGLDVIPELILLLPQ